ncbi:MAG: hypothetical protein K1X51_01290 [Rhodospirillaceae bacterium]|nr:hypothetical protein [Rhodospirillaceae bacterium]
MRTVTFAFVAFVGLLWLHDTVAADAKSADAPVAVSDARVPDTLMFTTDELTDIQSRIGQADAGAGANAGNAVENASLYLSSILYFSPTDWVIWVNGVPIEPHQDFQAFKVTDISPSSVELLVPLSAMGMRPVRLGPNQTFVAKSGIVVEGRVQ